MSYQKSIRPTGMSGKNTFELPHALVYVALLVFLSFMVFGGKSEMPENRPVEQPEVSTELLEMLAKWQAVRVPSKQHELLSRLVGEWDIALRFHAGEQKWESQCTSQSTLLHGGRFMLEQITGECYAPDETGKMRLEPYTGTRLLGYDNYKKAYVGAFIDNQNTHLLSWLGIQKPTASSEEIVMFGFIDEPMLDTHDTTMKYLLHIKDENNYVWERYALAVSDNAKVIDFSYSRRNAKN